MAAEASQPAVSQQEAGSIAPSRHCEIGSPTLGARSDLRSPRCMRRHGVRHGVSRSPAQEQRRAEGGITNDRRGMRGAYEPSGVVVCASCATVKFDCGLDPGAPRGAWFCVLGLSVERVALLC